MEYTKHPTISFRISPRERDEIEAKSKRVVCRRKIILYVPVFITKCVVVGKREVIYQLVEELHLMQYNITET